MALNKLTSKLDELLGIDIRALALMRIAFSLCILIDLCDHLPYIKMLYSDEGILPRAYAIHYLNPSVICLNLLNGSVVFQVLLFLLTALFAVGLLLGWRTRLCTFMVWILLCSFHNRNYFLLGAEDKLLHILFFWFLFLPWGACYSLDSRNQSHAPPPRVSSMASVAYLLQVCFFYSFAGLLKTDPQWTTQGTAMYYVMSIDEFIKPLGTALGHHPLIMHQMTFYVLWLERCGALLFFVPFKNLWFRLLGVAAFASFHLGIMLTMELRLFQWICLVMLIGFLPTAFLNKFLKPVSTSSSDLPAQKPSWKPNLFRMPAYMSVLVAFFLVYVLFWNLGDLEGSKLTVPRDWRWIGYTFNLDQHWGMFAPRPMTDDGWCMMPGRLRNGKIVDIFNGGRPITYEEPKSIPQLDKMYHLTLYYLNIRENANSYYREPWAEYVCREWNNTHPFDQQLMGLDIVFMEKDTLPDYQKPKIHPVLLLDHYCFSPHR